MKRNFDLPILDLDGKPVRVGLDQNTMQQALNQIFPKLSPELQQEFNDALEKFAGAPLTFGKACVSILLGAYEDEKNLDDSKRLSRMELARRINKGGVQEVTPNDLDTVKALVTKRYGGVLVPVTIKEMWEQEAEEASSASTSG